MQVRMETVVVLFLVLRTLSEVIPRKSRHGRLFRSRTRFRIRTLVEVDEIVEVDGRCEGVFSHTWDYGLAWFGILAVSLVNKRHSLNTVVRKFTNTMTNELIY